MDSKKFLFGLGSHHAPSPPFRELKETEKNLDTSLNGGEDGAEGAGQRMIRTPKNMKNIWLYTIKKKNGSTGFVDGIFMCPAVVENFPDPFTKTSGKTL